VAPAEVALGIIRLRPASTGAEDTLRNALREQSRSHAKLDGIISMHLLENDPALSLTDLDDPSAPNPARATGSMLIDATDVNAIPAAAARFATFKSRAIQHIGCCSESREERSRTLTPLTFQNAAQVFFPSL
jgi:hypothetical protein